MIGKRMWVLSFVLCMAWLASAQEIIRGTYSYTYGDSETLVAARQTCKNLALRDAIESYYVFIESTTQVENSQTMEDLIRTLSAGAVKDLKIVEQKEEGRTISMTVEGTVMPEEVKQAVAKAASAATSGPSGPASSAPPVAEENGDVRFTAVLSRYENRMNAAQRTWELRQYDAAVTQIQDIQKWLASNRPKDADGFHGRMHQSLTIRNDILLELIRIEKLEASNMKLRERAAVRQLAAKTAQLENQIRVLDRTPNLTGKQQMVRSVWLRYCRATALRARDVLKKYR